MNKNKIAIGLLVIIGIFYSIYMYYLHTKKYPDTDNAYISANLINIAPKVSGFIEKIYVQNNDFVHKGDILITIKPDDYQLELDKATKSFTLTNQQTENIEEQVNTVKSAVIKAESDAKLAGIMAERYRSLYEQKAGSLQDMQKYANQAQTATQALTQAKVMLKQALIQSDISKTQLDLSDIAVNNAKNITSYTKIIATTDGYVSNLNLATGQLVQAGQALFGIIDNTDWWVDANYKETQIANIKQGQKAIIKLDMYGHEYSGIVDSISRASGNTFSLLPAQNATGNWVKVTQRFAVKIKIQDNKDYPLRVGASAEVTIDTSQS